MARYLSGIRKQLQDVSDLFKTRYGKGSPMSEESGKALAAVARLERRFLLVLVEQPKEYEDMAAAANER